MASSTLDISKVPSMEEDEVTGPQTLTVRKGSKGSFPLTGIDTEKRSPSGNSNPYHAIVKVEQTSEDQISLNV